MIPFLDLIFQYFWLFASTVLLLVGDLLFVINSIQVFTETMKYRKDNLDDKDYLKRRLTAPFICIICNVVFGLILASFLYYASIHMI